MTLRLISLIALIGLWQMAAHFGNPRLLPGPMAVFETVRSEAASGALFAALGATLLTGYLGGAVATHLRVGDPLGSHVLFPVYVGALFWAGLVLRDARVRALVLPK